MSLPELTHEQQRVLKTVYVFNYPTPLEGIQMVLDPEIDEESVVAYLEELVEMGLIVQDDDGYTVSDSVDIAQVAPFKEGRSIFRFLKKSSSEEIPHEHKQLHSRSRAYWQYVHMDTDVNDLKSNLWLYDAMYHLHLLAQNLDLAQNAINLHAQALFHKKRYTEITEIEDWVNQLKAPPSERLPFYQFLIAALGLMRDYDGMLNAAKRGLSLALMTDNQHFQIDYQLRVADSYFYLKNYENALYEYKKVLAQMSTVGHKLSLHHGIARVSLAQNKLLVAEQQLAMAFALIANQSLSVQKKIQKTVVWDERKNIEAKTTLVIDLQSQIYEKRFVYREIIRLHQTFVDHVRDFNDFEVKSMFFDNTGYWYWVTGDFEKADKYFREAIAHDKTNVHAKSNLGSTMIAQGEFEEAQEWLTQVLQEADEDERGLALLNLGKLSLLQSNLTDTYKHFQTILSSPYEADILIALTKTWMVGTYLKDDKVAEAISIIEEVLNSEDVLNPAGGQNIYGIALLANGDVAAAAVAFSRASNIADEILTGTPDLYWALDGKGLALLGQIVCEKNADKISQAIPLFEKARSIVSAKGYLMELRLMFDLLQRHDSSGVLKDNPTLQSTMF
ncbi:MAG: tetratricopeptide repeat protein [Chloroflexi bacterium]|nr:tetratricopeptide repeat protein [Chloroflexota bacterium]